MTLIGGYGLFQHSRGHADVYLQLDPEQLRQAILRPTFIAYTGVNVVLMIVLTLLSRSSYGVRYIGVDVGLCVKSR